MPKVEANVDSLFYDVDPDTLFDGDGVLVIYARPGAERDATPVRLVARIWDSLRVNDVYWHLRRVSLETGDGDSASSLNWSGVLNITAQNGILLAGSTSYAYGP